MQKEVGMENARQESMTLYSIQWIGVDCEDGVIDEGCWFFRSLLTDNERPSTT